MLSSDIRPPSGQPEKMPLSFSIDGLQAREELLFKSLVRLLSHRTLHNWAYCQPMLSSNVNLKVIAEGIKLPSFALDAAQQVLTLGSQSTLRPFYLTLPLRADDLEKELNRIGTLITQKNAVLPITIAPNYLQSNLPNQLNDIASDPHVLMRLLRWPPTHLLGGLGRIRIATLMTGQPMTLNMLEARSGQTSQNCADFISDLKNAGLVVMVESNSVAPPERFNTGADGTEKTAHAPNQPAANLLARIRNRLGLFVKR